VVVKEKPSMPALTHESYAAGVRGRECSFWGEEVRWLGAGGRSAGADMWPGKPPVGVVATGVRIVDA